MLISSRADRLGHNGWHGSHTGASRTGAGRVEQRKMALLAIMRYRAPGHPPSTSAGWRAWSGAPGTPGSAAGWEKQGATQPSSRTATLTPWRYGIEHFPDVLWTWRRGSPGTHRLALRCGVFATPHMVGGGFAADWTRRQGHRHGQTTTETCVANRTSTLQTPSTRIVSGGLFICTPGRFTL